MSTKKDAAPCCVCPSYRRINILVISRKIHGVNMLLPLPPKICSACVWPCALVSLLSMTGILRGFSPSMLCSFDFQYTVAIVARHLIFRSPLLKCFVRRRNSRPSTAVSRPSRSTSVMWGPLKYCVSTGSPLMNQLSMAAGLDFAEVQLNRTTSPT